jgi:hypothetical protein
MFYESEPNRALRFGDILQGFVLVESNILDLNDRRRFEISVDTPSYCVVITPCCSIGNKELSITPLKQLWPSFYDNQYFVEDFTRINRTMKPEEAVSAEIWSKFPQEEKERRLLEKEGYAVKEAFIYEQHDLLPNYDLVLFKNKMKKTVNTNYYMIDYRDIKKIHCDRINSAKDSPYYLKILELTVQTRRDLRQKIGEYFNRVAPEDSLLLD